MNSTPRSLPPLSNRRFEKQGKRFTLDLGQNVSSKFESVTFIISKGHSNNQQATATFSLICSHHSTLQWQKKIKTQAIYQSRRLLPQRSAYWGIRLSPSQARTALAS